MGIGPTDPMEPWRRQQEQLRRALEGPLRNVLRQHDALREALDAPLANVVRAQQAWQRSVQPQVAVAAEQQRLLDAALRGPLEAAAQAQEQVRQALEGPVEVIRRNRDALNRALAAPYASLLQQQRWLLDAAADAAEASAIALEDLENLEGDTPPASWLRDFAAAIRAATPSKEQLELLLTQLSFLLALTLTVMGLPDGLNNPEEVAAAASTLFAGCALLLHYLRR